MTRTRNTPPRDRPAAAAPDVGAVAPAAAASAFTPLPYQRRWVADKARFKIGLMARQVGKSTGIALEVNARILEAQAEGRAPLWVLLSRGERQSNELARKVLELARMVGMGVDVLQSRTLVDEQGEWIEGSTRELRYRGGARVIALPANPDTARGYSGNVVLDEFAFHADSDAIWTALFPTITRGHDVRVISTPNGQQNRFYQLVTEASQSGTRLDWSLHRVSIYDAVSQGLDVDVEQLRAGIRDELAWRQEYECEFVDEATAWLSWDLIRAAEDPRATASAEALLAIADSDQQVGRNAVLRNPVYLGWDVARWSHLSVLWAVERVGDVLWTRQVLVMKGKKFDEQLSAVQQVARGCPAFVRLCIDATGIGEMPAEQAAQRLGAHRVEAVKFNGGVKELLAGDLRRVLEDRRLRLPPDEEVRQDLHSVRKTVTAAGNARFAGESDGSHADRFWAAALAVHAAQTRRAPRVSVL